MVTTRCPRPVRLRPLALRAEDPPRRRRMEEQAMTEMTPETAELARWLASTALVAYVGDARETALKAVQRIDRECGGDGVELALRAWIDTMASRIGVPLDRPIHLQFQCADGTGGITGADGVAQPETVWAGRLVSARIASDLDTYLALLNTLPEGPAETGAHVIAVLDICAMTMRRAGVTP